MPEVSETIPDALAPRVDAALAWFNSSAESAGDIFKVTGILDADAALNGSDELRLILCGGDRCEQRSFRVSGSSDAWAIESLENPSTAKLIDDKARKVISDFKDQFEKIDLPSREILEPIVNDLIKLHGTNFKGVGQPLRIALTGSKFGPGIYDIILSLGKEEVQKRLSAKIA